MTEANEKDFPIWTIFIGQCARYNVYVAMVTVKEMQLKHGGGSI